jgi:hypothetical protein
MEIGRRAFLKGAAAAGIFGVLPVERVMNVLAAVPHAQGHYLTARRLATLQAMTYRFIPGLNDSPGPLNSPPDTDPGAREAQCYRYIDILLAAFTFDPPMIHAGGPFSNRHGSPVDDFASFIPLDEHAELGWRIRIEGSRGIKAREFAGPVQGLQQAYDDGLDHLEARAMSAYAAHFADLAGAQQDAILVQAATPSDPDSGFIGLALGQTLEAMYGAPEYGGNRGRVGWAYTHFDGDVQPAGYTDLQVSQADAGPVLAAAAAHRVASLAPLFVGRAAPRDAPWLGRAPFRRG